jgi:hypothetical protein
MDPIIQVLVWLLIFILIAGLIYYIFTLLPLPEPWKSIALAILAVILVLILILKVLPLATGTDPDLGMMLPAAGETVVAMVAF